ncbi:hypothetical protein H8E88_25555 [candidate division KSB1 bacterium]|nr:hypothetical protein [candidate division KSB1 bacterium]
MKDPLPKRLGGLAANLARVNTFSSHGANRDAVFGLINESKYFIEWTALEAELEVAAQLVDLQVQLAYWQQEWETVWADKEKRQNIAQQSREWSDKVLELSGLLRGLD